MGMRGTPTLDAYLELLQQDPLEGAHLVDALLLKTTWMFRHKPTFDVLRGGLLADLMRLRSDERMGAMRAWIVGCSTGEEAYSLAMCMAEAQEQAATDLELQVIATDVAPAALARASTGKFAPGAVAEVPRPLADRWLSRREGQLEVSGELRRLVSFARFDVLGGGPAAPSAAVITSFDVVCCRNVLIYFRKEPQQAALGRLLKACAPGALVVLGEAERPHADFDEALAQLSPPEPVYRAR
jgi:chemotaxis methyl-accepting protein methylase